MAASEQVLRYLDRLPPVLHAEVLDFIEYLLTKVERQEAQEWSSLSLEFAMRGMDDEDSPEYTLADIKVAYNDKGK